MQQIDTDTTILPLDVAAELERLEARADELEASPTEEDQRERGALLLQKAQLYLAVGEAENEREALAALWAAWECVPGDTDTLLILERVLARRGTTEERLRLLLEGAQGAPQQAVALGWLERAISLARTSGGAGEDLYSTFRSTFEADSALLSLLVQQAPRTARRLVAALLEAGEDSLAYLILGRLGVERHEPESFDDALNLARLAERLGEDEQAFEAYRMALTLRPAAAEALQPTRRHLANNGRHEQLAELLAVSAAAAKSPREGAALWRELAQLAESELADRSRAVQAWWRAWELGQEGDEAAEIKRLYAAEQRWSRYLDVLRQESLRTADVERKVEIVRELATFQLEVMDDVEGGAAALEQVLQLVPADEAALSELVVLRERLCAQAASADEDERSQWPQLLSAMRRFIAACGDLQRREAMLRRLIDRRVADEDVSGIVTDLEHLDGATEENLALANELWERALVDEEPLASERRSLTLLLARWLEEYSAEGISGTLELAVRCREAGEQALAQQLVRQLAARHPDEPRAAAALARLRAPRRAVETPERRLARLAERAARVQPADAAQAAQLLIQAAQLGLRHTGSRDTAESFLLTARDICPPGAREQLLALESAFLEAGLEAEVTTLLETRVGQCSQPEERRRLQWALARHHLDHDPTKAIAVLEELRRADPDDHEAIAQLERAYEAAGNEELLAELLAEQLEGKEGRRRIELLERLGELYRPERLDDPERALRTYGELLRLAPHNAPALAMVRQQAEQANDPRTVVVLLSRAAESEDDPRRREALHREVARLAEEKLGDLDVAIGQWRQLMALAPESEEPRGALQRLLREAERWTELEGHLLAEVSRQTDDRGRVALYLALAHLAQDQLGNPRGAASHLRNARKLAAHDADVLEELAALHEQLGQWRELAAILVEQAELPDAPLARRVTLLLRGCRVLLSQLGRDDEALALCQRVRELSPTEPQASTILAEIFARREEWGPLAGLLRERIAVESDPQRLARLHVEMGQLLLEHLASPEAAATHFEMALEFDAQSGEVLGLLRELYATLGRWDLLVELVRRRALGEGLDKQSRAEAFYEMGELFAERLDDPTSARDAYTQALKLQPDHRPSLAAQRALVEQAEEWREAVTLARRELDTIDHPPDRSRLLVKIAEMLDSHLARPSAAMDALEQALGEDPHNAEALQRLAETTFSEKSWERAASLLTRLCDDGEELPDLHAHYYRLAYALEQLGDDDKAFSHYVKSFGREPMYLPTLERLVDLCYVRRQWENTLRIAEAIISSYADDKSPEELADYYVRLGFCELHLAQTSVATAKLRELILGPGERPETSDDAWQDVAVSWAATPADPTLIVDVDLKVITRVIKAMEQALARVPDHSGALQLLAGLTMARGDWDRALRYLERAAEASQTDAPLRRSLLMAAGDIAAQRLLSTRRAETYYRKAGQGEEASPEVRRRIEKLGDRPQRAPAPRSRHAPRSRPRSRPTPRHTPPPLPPPDDDDGFDNMRTQPLPMLGDAELPALEERRPMPPKKGASAPPKPPKK